MTRSIVIWGASGHARVVADAARMAGISVAGFLDDNESRRGEPFFQSTVLGGAGILADLFAEGARFIHVAIGDCAARLRLADVAVVHGFLLETVVHSRAIVAADVALGAGTFVAGGAIVNPGARIGCNVILNTACSVDHDCVVEDGVHIGPGVRVGGAARIGRGAWIGIGASLIDRVSVGAGAIVGAGSVVVRNIPPGVVAYGVPARFVRNRTAQRSAV